MKKFHASLLAAVLMLGAAVPAHAENFVVDEEMYARHKHEQQAQMQREREDRNTPEYRKGQYSGSSGYTGRLTGQVAFREKTPGNKTAFVVRPVRGKKSEFNTTFRYGDMSQSREARTNHSFNN